MSEKAPTNVWNEFRRTGSTELRNQLIERYLPQVRYLAERMSARLLDHVETDDLQQAGVFGLMDAVDKFDPERGVKFETYCQQRVSGAMLDQVRANDWVPRLVRARAAQLDRAHEALFRELGREPSDDELATHLGMSKDEYDRFSRDASAVAIFSYDAPVPGPDTSETRPDRRIDLLEAASSNEILDALHQSELMDRIVELLDEKERLVLMLYYHEKLTLREIGQVLDLSESRICQIHTRLVNRLRTRLERIRQDLAG